MPRQSRGPAPRRPTVAPARPAPPPQQQTRSASTTTAPGQAQRGAQAPPAQQGGGMMSNIASTAAGVAVGSSIGHMVSGFFGGGSSHAAESAPMDQAVAQDQQGNTMMNSQFQSQAVCANDVNNFKRCMDDNQGNLTICGWYLDQLKACQSAASQY
ncbi:hypothetical protein B0A48_18259 [Cryoendolithus antarcticus]|uniref:CHCH domain-containing protein n=1 Tax=Cryoendolithus antarcticus TaxID=1507870 RepID=A0A1V8S9K4_9PEZI|nr:hypothetical protein B0A48_18259 [Cryoendolithus antarcticus]